MTADRSDQRIRRKELRFDVCLAIVLSGIFVPVTALLADDWAPNDRPVDLSATILVGLAFLVLVFRRRAPLVTLGIVATSATVYLWASYPYGPILGALFIAVYTVADRVPFRTAAFVTGMSMAVMLTHVFVHPTALGGWLGLIPGAAWVVVPFAIGVSIRTSRQARWAAQDEVLRRHLHNERMRLAQEVHDVVGHGLAAIQLQADIALHVDEDQPPRTREALKAISGASKAAFAELASTLEVIQPSRSSQPGIDEIEGLCERMKNAGVDLEFTLIRRSKMRDEQAGLVAYRVLQEALTNVIRHGEMPTATATVEVDDEAIHIRVNNPGTAPAPAGSGRGLSGMRRRVEGLGGSFQSGPTAEGGFVVEARIPHGGPS